MPVKLNQIPGVMIDVKEFEILLNTTYAKQESVSIGLNREELVKLIQEYFGIIEIESPSDIYKDMEETTSKFINWTVTHNLADTIIANESSLIERKDDAKGIKI